MSPSRTSRRSFCARAAACSAATALQSSATLRAAGFAAQPAPSASASRPDVAAIDHDRILAAAQHYLTQPPTPLTSLVCPRSSGAADSYYSEPEPSPDAPLRPGSPPPFTAHRDALFSLGLAVPALAAACVLSGEARYADHAATHLRAWFVNPATRMKPAMDFAQSTPASRPPHTSTGRYQGILEALPLVEIAQSIPFLTTLNDADRAALHAWFAAYYHWLTDPQDSGPRLAALARDSKSHHGTSWMLQACAFAYLAAPTGDAARAENPALTDLRHRFKTLTLRAQISPDGTFPHELGSQWPYRDSLFNLDMLAAICELLSTRFESLWDYQLDEGPGMRGAIAYHFPFIADRGMWPFRADADHFEELPSRRASLLLSARAYRRPEYAALWKTLQPDPSTPAILRTLPIHQPLLWVRQPPSA